MKEVHKMKKTKLILLAFLILITTIVSPVKLQGASKQAVYFKEGTCLVCQELEGLGYIDMMINDGIDVKVYDIQSNIPVDEYSYVDSDGETVQVLPIDVFAAFNDTYKREANGVPVIFIGDSYFEGITDISEAYERGTFNDLSDDPLLEVSVTEGQAYKELTFFAVLGAGLLDGFNPCAIALLLLFVSLLGFSEDKRVLILVSIVYISALYVSYFLIGTFFLGVLAQFKDQISVVTTIINWFVALLCFFLFAFNFYDFLKAKNEDYKNIKNQLPKWLQKLNKRIVKSFTSVINDKENKKGLISVLALTFVLGVTLSITELVCTGQIYFAVLYGIHTAAESYAVLLLVLYNLMFVLPLIIIAVIAVKSRSVMSVSNWVREHMVIIKFMNAMLFLGIAVYFFLRIFIIKE